ncbi:hypothetical protein [Herbidospora sp. NBRC 101105]|uniref:RICIN domain-containing protein n=1 Tax=Herbidospora sp. NBRC 101105 TaxID=3032195 RepID=UPI0024A271C8|nr:hypothetical protein [Herbidospora sp. NBRC 101105]GLX99409.1 hypothetical protein Hesp01_73590 [Herbidospora sp. NBRC 101105]
MKSLRIRTALPATLTTFLLAGSTLLVSTPADAAPGQAARLAQALALTPVTQPGAYPPFVDGRQHVVENVNTRGFLIHEYWSAPGCTDAIPCRLQAWTGGVTPPANEWYFEDAQARNGYIWFRMRNAKSNKCAVPGGVAWALPTAVVKTCSNGDEFLWRAEPERIGDWRTAKFVSYTTRRALKPFGTTRDEFLVLNDDGNTSKYYWTVSQ